jgi:hypothetical protein
LVVNELGAMTLNLSCSIWGADIYEDKVFHKAPFPTKNLGDKKSVGWKRRKFHSQERVVEILKSK